MVKLVKQLNVFISTLILAVLPLLSSGLYAAEQSELVYLQKARDYRSEGKLKSAAIELKNALKKNPKSAEARFLLGQVYLQLKLGAAAEKELRKSHKLALVDIAEPLARALIMQGKFDQLLEEIIVTENLSAEQQTQLHTLRGEAYTGLVQLYEAEQEFQAALNIDPSNARALVGQARIHLANAELDEAYGRIKLALDSEPESAIAWNLAGDIHQAQDNFQAAEQAYTQAMKFSDIHSVVQLKRALARIELEDYDGADKDIKTVKKVAKNIPDVEYAQGLLSFRQQRFAEAAKHFQVVLNESPKHPESLYYQGVSLFALNEFERAEFYLESFLTLVPDSKPAAKALGFIRLRLKNYTGAEAVLAPAVARNPEDGILLRAMGQALMGQGKVEQGKEYLQQAVDLAPEAAGERMELAVSHLRLGQRDLGLQALQKASQLDPNLIAVDLMIIRVRLQAQEYDAALDIAKKLRKKRPESPDPVTLTGIAYLGKGDTDKARTAFNKALEIKPGNANAALNLASMEQQAGRIDQAREYYHLVLEHNPGHPAALLRFAGLEAEQGNKKQAYAYFEQAIEANPSALAPPLAMARALLDDGQAVKALGVLRKVQDQHAETPTFLAIQGDVQMAAGKPGNAVRTYRKLVDLQPKSADAHYLLGSAYLAAKETIAATQELKRGLSLDADRLLASGLMTDIVNSLPTIEDKQQWVLKLKVNHADHPQVMDLEAQLAFKQKQPDKAVRIYKELYARFPEEPVWSMNYANAQWQAGDHQGYFATVKTWLKDHPNDTTAQLALAYNYLKLDRQAEATKAFKRLLELEPNNVVALNNLAWLVQEDDLQQALSYAKKAVGVSADARVMDTYGTLLLHNGKAGRAVDILQKAAAKRPDLPTIRYHLATALVELGKPEEARKLLKGLVKEDFPERDKATSLLAKVGGGNGV